MQKRRYLLNFKIFDAEIKNGNWKVIDRAEFIDLEKGNKRIREVMKILNLDG